MPQCALLAPGRGGDQRDNGQNSRRPVGGAGYIPALTPGCGDGSGRGDGFVRETHAGARRSQSSSLAEAFARRATISGTVAVARVTGTPPRTARTCTEPPPSGGAAEAGPPGAGWAGRPEDSPVALGSCAF